MNLGQAIDPETLRLHESGIRQAFGAAVRETLGRLADAAVPWWERPEAPAADRLQLRGGSASAEVVGAIERAGRPMSLQELRDALPLLSRSSLKQAVFALHGRGQIVRHGECKSYRYGLPR